MSNQMNVDAASILSPSEREIVDSDLVHKSKRSKNARINRIIFHLGLYAGLRASEICGITLGNVLFKEGKAFITINKQLSKNGKRETIEVFNGLAIQSLQGWKEKRQQAGAGSKDLFLVSEGKKSTGKKLTRNNIYNRVKNMVTVLGNERKAVIHTHSLRHSFVTYALELYGLAYARIAARHSNISITSNYIHISNVDRPIVEGY